MRPRSDAYKLTVRQGPQRAKAFAGPKEKDRKPVDPPPIVQLHIIDPEDPAQNYLQSPYFFMVVNLQDADLSRPGQLAAAHQGEALDTATQSALAGTLVSSLHRLKDVDNTDGGFFVFPDLSVKIEGDFRLRFSLFEMLKSKVAYIKSAISEPFTVFTPRAFPGMSESTFLSRSFGDQGVKLRIRKEPRVLGKRAAPTEFITSANAAHGHPQQSSVDYQAMPPQGQDERAGGFVAGAYGDPYETPLKKQRISIGLDRRAASDGDHQRRDPYTQHSQRDLTAATRSSYYSQGPLSASGAAPSDFSFGHQRTNSSSTSSPFVSPRHEYSGYSFSAPNNSLYDQRVRDQYQQPTRDQSYQYQQGQYLGPQSRPVPQIAQPMPPLRPLLSTLPSQIEQPRPYQRYDIEEHPPAERAYGSIPPASRPDYYTSQAPPISYDRPAQPLARTLPDPSQPSTSVLPPLQSTLPSSQPRGDPLQSYSSSGGPSIEGHSQLQSYSTSGGPSMEGQSFLPQYYRGPQSG